MNIQPQSVTVDKASSKATTALVLGILGIVCCGLCAPIAWIIGSGELKQIKSGLSSQAGKGFAQAGMIMGIIGTILIIISIIGIIIYIALFGMMAATHIR
jgi:hypothetical protein